MKWTRSARKNIHIHKFTLELFFVVRKLFVLHDFLIASKSVSLNFILACMHQLWRKGNCDACSLITQHFLSLSPCTVMYLTQFFMLDEFIYTQKVFSRCKHFGGNIVDGKHNCDKCSYRSTLVKTRHECARSGACDNSLFSCSAAENSVKLTFRMFMEREREEKERVVISQSFYIEGKFSEWEKNSFWLLKRTKNKENFPPRKIFSFPCSVRVVWGWRKKSLKKKIISKFSLTEFEWKIYSSRKTLPNFGGYHWLNVFIILNGKGNLVKQSARKIVGCLSGKVKNQI